MGTERKGKGGMERGRRWYKYLPGQLCIRFCIIGCVIPKKICPLGTKKRAGEGGGKAEGKQRQWEAGREGGGEGGRKKGMEAELNYLGSFV